jgi:hypothetical protein
LEKGVSRKGEREAEPSGLASSISDDLPHDAPTGGLEEEAVRGRGIECRDHLVDALLREIGDGRTQAIAGYEYRSTPVDSALGAWSV